MASPSELTLDCKPHNYSILLKSFGDQPDQTQKLEDFLSCLEEERLKIDAFKRELPLCMQLLSNAMEASRQQLQTCRTYEGQKPVLEEFIPIKHSNSEETDKASEKASWMISAQLWSQSNESTKQQTPITSPKKSEHSFGISSKLALDNKLQRNGGAFLPFSKDRNPNLSSTLRVLPELALASSEVDVESKKCNEGKRESADKTMEEQQGKGGGNQAEAPAATTSQTHRKARRCWSPDLHRRFVNALQMLGGSQVATPKQIRELMKVDGLTNDEVKSHLQKYRLHTRRPSPSPQSAGAPTPQLVVLGGIWVPPEYATAAHNASPALYSAHPVSHTSSHYCAPPVPQDFYPPPSHQLHHTLHHHQHHLYKASSQTHTSPESDVRGNGSESIEDEKSESSSWKGDSGEKKGLASLRDDREESNGSKITLNF